MPATETLGSIGQKALDHGLQRVKPPIHLKRAKDRENDPRYHQQPTRLAKMGGQHPPPVVGNKNHDACQKNHVGKEEGPEGWVERIEPALKDHDYRGNDIC